MARSMTNLCTRTDIKINYSMMHYRIKSISIFLLSTRNDDMTNDLIKFANSLHVSKSMWCGATVQWYL